VRRGRKVIDIETIETVDAPSALLRPSGTLG
jgi:hypothetical protein